MANTIAIIANILADDEDDLGLAASALTLLALSFVGGGVGGIFDSAFVPASVVGAALGTKGVSWPGCWLLSVLSVIPFPLVQGVN